MKEFDSAKWLEKFEDNYYGRTEQAKELENYLKSAYKGGNYIPWAVMQRMIYQQDPSAEFKVYGNPWGTGFIYTDALDIVTLQKDNDKMLETKSSAFAHTVKVSVTFLGKTVEEIYPIQDSKVKGAAYTAPKAYDSNLLNNAIKRALTKAGALASGLALTLYENGDLQFETVEEKPQEINRIVEPKTIVEETKEDTPTIAEDVVVDDTLQELATYIHGNKDLEKGIKLMNTAIFKKHKFVLDVNESVEEIKEKLSHLENAEKFVGAIKFQSGVK